jgi:transposase, IS5 family
VLRTTSPQPSLWETILPAELLGLPAELARVDALLDDSGFLAPFATHTTRSLAARRSRSTPTCA